LMPGLRVEPDKPLALDGKERADLIVGDGTFNVIVELKRAKPDEASIRNGLSQLTTYMNLAKAIHGILFFAPGEPGEIEIDELPIPRVGGYALVLRPKSSSVAL